MKNAIIGSVALGLVAVAGQAQEITYGGLLAGYSQLSTTGGEVDLTVFGGEVGMDFGAFDAWINTTQIKADVTGVPFALDFGVNTVGAGYSFGEYRVDVSSTDLSLGAFFGPLPTVGIDEIGFAYDNGTYFGRLSYATVAPDVGFIDNIISVHAGYAPSDAIEVSLSVHAIDEASGSVDPIYILSGSYDGGAWGAELEAASVNIGGTDLSLVSLGGDYQFNDQWGAYGNYTRANIDFVEIDVVRVGATYNINDNVHAFADVSNITNNTGGDDIRGFSVGISMDLGDKPASYETSADRLFGVVETALALDF